jgi:hypothetical protein
MYPDSTPAFITGSRDLGSMSEDSDIDVVMLVKEDAMGELIGHSDLGKLPCRYGGKQGINFILCRTPEEYKSWAEALRVCEDMQERLGRPLTKPERLALHRQVFEDNGFPDYFSQHEPSSLPRGI